MQELLSSDTDKEGLTEFVFSENEYSVLVWEDKNEFNYLDSKYDVVDMKKDDQGKIHIMCLSDKKETELYAHFAEKEKQNTDNSSNQKNSRTFSKFFGSDFLLLKDKWLFSSSPQTLLFSTITVSFHSLSTAPAAPPPELS